MGKGTTIGLLAGIALLALFTLDTDRRAAPIDERYPGPWRADYQVSIAKALAGAGARGCGEFVWRESAIDRGEVLVWCTTDRTAWQQWLTWPRTARASGPSPPDARLPPPG